MGAKTIEGPLLGETLGREIVGVDLAKPLASNTFDAIKVAFRENPVLVFRNQSIEARQFAVFARRFGPIRPGVSAKYQHPDVLELSYLTNIDAAGKIDDFGVKRASAWHYDGSFAERPPILAMLNGLEIPEIGGGTLFADMYRAYETLPAKLKRCSKDLITVNHFGLGPAGKDYFEEISPERWGDYAPVRRPLVMSHRLSSRWYLEFCMIHTVEFVGMTHGEGLDLLHELEAHVAGDANVYYHAWRPGDVVIWDEHATMHRNAGDFPSHQRRVMLRAMVNGS